MPAPLLDPPSRESVTTIRADGSRRFLYPADARGRFARARLAVGWLLLALVVALPLVRINGYPAVLLDVAGRRFHFFGLTLADQDLWLLFFGITGLGFSLFFVTSLLGRVWCGWTCPQTVLLEQVFRRIERVLDGDAVARRALEAAPRSAGKVGRRVLKHGLFLLVAAFLPALVLAYFVSWPGVGEILRTPGDHPAAVVFFVVATGLLWFNFAWFREQLCIVICPYGRIQSALIDDHSLVIGYDARRGEPRGHAQAGGGDCVDCFRCVAVCPTGIDIRQGLQMECIGCAACVDACDEVMTRLHRPRGLIRYASHNALAGRPTRWVRPRTIVYFVLLVIGASVATWAVSTVRPAAFLVTHMIGAPYIVDDTTVRNQFFVRLVNKLNAPAHFVLHVNGAPAGLRQSGFADAVEVAPLGEVVLPLILQQARAAYTGPFLFEVRVDDTAGTYHLARQVEFLGPEARLLHEDAAAPPP
jgi:cytochrome c oxidase accessory protein FixG